MTSDDHQKFHLRFLLRLNDQQISELKIKKYTTHWHIFLIFGKAHIDISKRIYNNYILFKNDCLQIFLVLKTINLKLTMPRVLYIKWSTNFLYLICKGKKTMVKIIKFIQIFIVFLSLIVLITSDSKLSSKSISNYLLYIIHNHSSLFSNIPLFLFDVTDKLFCYNDDDCTSNLCRSPPYVRKCRLFLCYCEPKCQEKQHLNKLKNYFYF
jgi:hypothetical protein